MKNVSITIIAATIILLSLAIVLLWKTQYSISPKKIKRLNQDIDSLLLKYPESSKEYNQKIKILKELVEFENQQHVLKFLQFAHKNYPEGIDDNTAELIVNSKNPYILNLFEEWIDSAFQAGIINDAISYAPYIYQNKEPKKLYLFFEKLSNKEPDWPILFPAFNPDLLIDLKAAKIKGLNIKIARDYFKAIKECPSEYTKKSLSP